jgi:hypothetical protein
MTTYEAWSSHSDKHVDCGILGCGVVCLRRWLPILWSNLTPSSSVLKPKRWQTRTKPSASPHRRQRPILSQPTSGTYNKAAISERAQLMDHRKMSDSVDSASSSITFISSFVKIRQGVLVLRLASIQTPSRHTLALCKRGRARWQSIRSTSRGPRFIPVWPIN